MDKIDLKKEMKHLYGQSAKKVEIVDVPKFSFVMVDGEIEPGKTPETSEQFQHAIGALYGMSFTLKFASKLREKNPIDYAVMPLEGLWWAKSGAFDFDKKDNWQWTLMILQPKHITKSMYNEALRTLKDKKDNPALSIVRFESFREGKCVQTLHVGPYSEEPATIEKMKVFAKENSLKLTGKHHEIYLGDPRRCKPERLKTILRHPVKK